MSTSIFKIEDIAKTYADLPYQIELEAEVCDGQECVVAYNPELEGCMAFGTTSDQALENLKEARVEYIVALLERGIPVNTPLFIGKTRQISESYYFVNYEVSPIVRGEVVQPEATFVQVPQPTCTIA
jgi:predicted RNase H-like HicB family nuclease